MFENNQPVTILLPSSNPLNNNSGGDHNLFIYFTPVCRDEVTKRVLVTYGTSAEFPYCNIFGEFKTCDFCKYYFHETCHAHPKFFSYEKAENLVNLLIKQGGEFV